MRVAILGAGVAGAATALMLSRQGHDVIVVDRDRESAAPVADAEEVFAGWDRPAIGQFRQPHNFLGRARVVLRDHLPDVYAALRTAGAGEIDQRAMLGAVPRLESDADLATITCRRPVFDAVLRECCLAEPGIAFRLGDAVGLDIDRRDKTPRVTGVRLAGGAPVSADLVVDASGRNTSVPRWLAASGVRPWPERHADCGLLYFSRHYRVHDGVTLPMIPMLGGPRGDLGYLAYAVFVGDNATYSLCIMPPAWDKLWRLLREPEAFDRVARLVPGMADWLAVAEPITGVLPMGQLRNTLRIIEPDALPVAGIVPVGDALSHTNPTFAFGASMALAQALTLANVADQAMDACDLAGRFADAVGTEVTARFDAVNAEDRDRRRAWSGESIDVTDRHATMPLFLRSVAYRVAPQDPELFRAVCRRVDALDPVDALAHDDELLTRAERLYHGAADGWPGPPARDALVSALAG